MRSSLSAILKKNANDVVVSLSTCHRGSLSRSFVLPAQIVWIADQEDDGQQFVTSLRTPIGKFRGGFKDMYPEELLSHVLKSTKERLEAQGLDVDGGAVQDIHVGTVLMELGGAKSGRLASLDAG